MRRQLSKHLIYIAGLVAFMSGALGQDTDLTQIKERELEEVRAQISRLKRSMDKRAVDRDRITGELQAAEVKISETRLHLKELERQRDAFSAALHTHGLRRTGNFNNIIHLGLSPRIRAWLDNCARPVWPVQATPYPGASAANGASLRS